MSKQIEVNPFSITVTAVSLLSIVALSCGITDIITHNSLKNKFRNDVLKKQVNLMNLKYSNINTDVSFANNNCTKPSSVHNRIYGQQNLNLADNIEDSISPDKQLLEEVNNLAINPSAENFDDESDQLLELYHKYVRPEHIPSQKVPRTIRICHIYAKVFWSWETVDLDSFLNRPNSYLTEGNIGYVKLGDTQFNISNPDSLKSVYRKLNMYRRLIIENSIKNTIKK